MSFALAAGVAGSMLPACSSSSASSPKPTAATVGAAGGHLASSDGALEIDIPAGALGASVEISIARITSPASGALGAVYEIGPTGTTFSAPVRLTFHYAGADLGGGAEDRLRVATLVSGAWSPIGDPAVDKSVKTVSGVTTHLSPYTFILAGSGELCIGTSGGSAGSSVGGPPPPPPTCESSASTACAGYPGASLKSCTNSATGYRGDCCFPAGQPACVVSGYVAGGTGGGGSPTCATVGNACTGVPGTTTKSCVDRANGFDATCCYPVGVVPPPPEKGDSGAP